MKDIDFLQLIHDLNVFFKHCYNLETSDIELSDENNDFVCIIHFVNEDIDDDT